MREGASAPAYRLRGVAFRYPDGDGPALADVDLDLDDGVFTAVIGPNGAGKSTLVRLLGGLRTPDRGEIRFLDRPLREWRRPTLARRLAVVSQEAPQGGLPLTVASYVELGRNPWVSPWAALTDDDRKIVERALARTELVGLRGRPLSALSGGERQRAKLARALAQDPGILVLDEPTVHLDFRHALWIFQTIRDLVDREELTAICITHDMNLASRFADRVVLLEGGRLRAAGSPEALFGSDALADAYGCDVAVERHPTLGHYVLPVRARGEVGAS